MRLVVLEGVMREMHDFMWSGRCTPRAPAPSPIIHGPFPIRFPRLECVTTRGWLVTDPTKVRPESIHGKCGRRDVARITEEVTLDNLKKRYRSIRRSH